MRFILINVTVLGYVAYILYRIISHVNNFLYPLNLGRRSGITVLSSSAVVYTLCVAQSATACSGVLRRGTDLVLVTPKAIKYNAYIFTNIVWK